MLAGPVQGRFFELLVHASGAKRILEIGTFTGYSTLSMAAALPEDGRIDTLEIAAAETPRSRSGTSTAVRTVPRSHFTSVPRSRRSRSSRASSTSSSSTRTSRVRTRYYEAVLPRLSARGLIAIDNTLWSGKVLDPQDERTKWIAR